MAVPDYTRVYTEGGTVSHLLDGLRSPNTYKEAICGRSPWPSLWFGTGTQEEEEKAQDLKTCISCLSVVRHRQGRG